MKPRESLKISLKALSRSRVRVLLTTLGIITSVFLIFVLFSVGHGTARQSMGMITDLAPNAVAVVHGYFPTELKAGRITFSLSEVLQNMGEAAEEGLPLFGSRFEPEMSYTLARELPQGTSVTPLSVDIRSVTFGDRKRNVLLFATNEQYPLVRNQGVSHGRFFGPGDRGKRVCVLGSYLREQLFGEIDAVGREVFINGLRFRVTGVLEPRGSAFIINNDDMILVPYWVGGHLGAGKADGFLLSAPDRSGMDTVKSICSDTLKSLVGSSSFTVVTQDELLELAGDAMRLIELMALIVTLVALLVGGVGIMNIMLVAVTERFHEIGIRKAIGAAPRDILMQFIFEAVIMGIAGGVAGILLGFGFVKMLEVLFNYPSYVSTLSVVLAFSFSIAAGLVFGVWPAVKAARLDPVESLRHKV